MKQTIAELGINNFGWIIYDDFFHPKQIMYVQVVALCTEEPETLTPRYFVKEYFKYNDIPMSRTLTLFGDKIVYSTYEEAEEKLNKEVSDTITSFEQKSVDWEKLFSELESIQKQFNEVTEDQKKDFCTFIKKLKNIADQQPDDINWKQVRIDISSRILNALVTKFGATSSIQNRDSDIKIAIDYGDALIKELKRSEALFEEKLKEI